MITVICSNDDGYNWIGERLLKSALRWQCGGGWLLSPMWRRKLHFAQFGCSYHVCMQCYIRDAMEGVGFLRNQLNIANIHLVTHIKRETWRGGLIDINIESLLPVLGTSKLPQLQSIWWANRSMFSKQISPLNIFIHSKRSRLESNRPFIHLLHSFTATVNWV